MFHDVGTIRIVQVNVSQYLAQKRSITEVLKTVDTVWKVVERNHKYVMSDSSRISRNAFLVKAMVYIHLVDDSIKLLQGKSDVSNCWRTLRWICNMTLLVVKCYG